MAAKISQQALINKWTCRYSFLESLNDNLAGKLHNHYALQTRHMALGKVVEMFTGPDGIARSRVIKTALGTLTRSAVKLALVEPKPDF